MNNPHRVPRNLSEGGFDAIFFDLDGTLVDTAPDMVATMTSMQDDRQQEHIPYVTARNSVSNGALGLLRLGFPGASEVELQELLAEYLEIYGNAVCVQSEVFTPLRDLLNNLSANDRLWGIVTNKPKRLTDPLLAKLNLAEPAVCAISGDTLAERKPHPAPLLHAAEIAQVVPNKVIYVGDAVRDIEAGRAAGMATVAVGYGYINESENVHDWGADAFAADTMALMRLLLRAVDLEHA